jgi:hypothetical protein
LEGEPADEEGRVPRGVEEVVGEGDLKPDIAVQWLMRASLQRLALSIVGDEDLGIPSRAVSNAMSCTRFRWSIPDIRSLRVG